MQKKIQIILLIALAIVAIALILLYTKNPRGPLMSGEVMSSETVVDKDGKVSEVVEKPQKKISEEEYSKLITEALKYKGLGDQGDKSAYLKAIEWYQKASDLSDNTLFIPILNIGNIYKLMGDYKKADEYYNRALKIAADSMIYMAQIELHELYLKSPVPVIQKLYDTALKTTIENTNLYLQYASFLKKNGYYADALNIYRELSKRYPDNK